MYDNNWKRLGALYCVRTALAQRHVGRKVKTQNLDKIGPAEGYESRLVSKVNRIICWSGSARQRLTQVLFLYLHIISFGH